MGDGLTHFLLTGFDSKNNALQIHAEIDTTDPRTKSPISCCTNAASTNYWRKHLSGFDIKRVSNIKQISGSTRI